MDRDVYRRMRQIERAHWWFAARRAILTSEIAGLSLPAGARIAEVGCGTGGNLQMLAQFGAVSAVEPDEEARGFAFEATGIRPQHGLLPDGLPLEPASFDLVASLDVVEHVDDDAGAVAALSRLTRPGGYVLATVPAYSWMFGAHDAHHHHKRRYTRRSFVPLFRKAGLRLVKATHFNALLFPPIAAARLLGKLSGREAGDDEKMPSPGVNRLLERVFATERHILRRTSMPFGVSILVVAQRPG